MRNFPGLCGGEGPGWGEGLLGEIERLRAEEKKLWRRWPGSAESMRRCESCRTLSTPWLLACTAGNM